jgi:hypothetical protein
MSSRSSTGLRRFPYAFADHQAARGECRAVIANYVWIKGADRTENAETHTQLVIRGARAAGRPA